MKFLKNKEILVTGGTGSFGHHIVKKLLKMSPSRITVFSRDEEKHYRMENEFEDYIEKLNFVVGDIRDYERVLDVTMGKDIIYHAAAVKQVPRCEFHPIEAVKTNVLGALNVKTAAIQNNVGRVIAISTDKAVKPVNVMGMTKAIQERIMVADNSEKGNTKFTCVRYGNVIGSRGSVIPFFKERIEQKKFIPLTHSEMTRFLLSLDDAIELVFKATESDENVIVVKKSPSCKIIDIANVMKSEFSSDVDIKYIGIRPGEKIHEVLVSEEEINRSLESDKFYIIYPHGVLNSPKLLSNLREYTSETTEKLNPEEIRSLLKKTGCL